MGLIDDTFHEGHTDTLYGPPGSGKTNFAVYIMQLAVELGYHIFTTIHFFKIHQVGQACNLGRLPKGITYKKVPEEVKTVTSLSDLLLGLLRREVDSEGHVIPRKNLVVIDEAGIFAPSNVSKKTRQIKELAYIIRHLNAAFFLICQARKSLPPDLRDTLVKYEFRIKKFSKYYREVTIKRAKEVYNEETGEEEVRFVQVGPVIRKVPLTYLPWDGFFIPRFDFDIDLTDAFNNLGKYNSLELIEMDSDGKTRGEKIILQMLEDKDKKDKKPAKKENKQQIREDVKNLYLSLEDSGKFKKRTHVLAKIAEQYGKTTQWAYQICIGLPFDEDKYNKKIK